MATSLANKYRPQTLDQVCAQGTTVDIIRKLCSAPTLSNRNFLFIGPSGCGKAQPLYSKVLTPSGFIAMGDVQVGTDVITGSGAVAKVSGIYPQGVRPIYEITLQDMTKIRVSDEHLNVVYRYNQDKKCREDYCLTTKELISFHKDSRFKLRIDTPLIQTFGEDDTVDQLPIDPYLLGAFIGDGSISASTSIKFSNGESDVIDNVDRILRRDWDTCLHRLSSTGVDYSIATVGYSTYKYIFIFDGNQYLGVDAMQRKLVDLGYPRFGGDTLLRICDNTASSTLNKYPELIGRITYSIDNKFKLNGECTKFAEALSSLDLRRKSVNKHIPKQYLLSSADNRLALLQGLFDTDGYISKDGAVEYVTSSKQLSEDFAFLVRSLGIRDTVVQKLPKYKYNGELRTGHLAYRHSLKIPNGLQFYTSTKHASRYTDRQQPPLRNIVSIQYVGDELCQCIYVDHSDHTYISDDFIPTHNTTISRIIAKSLNGTAENLIEIDAASHSSVDDTRDLIKEASQYPIGSKYKIFIIDECFPANTPILTDSGPKCISDIRPNDVVYGMTGKHRVTHLFKNPVLTSRLCCVKISNRNIITTSDHLFFTNNGWVCAKDLVQGDILYADNVYKNVSSMSEGFSGSEQPQIRDLLFFKLREQISLCSAESSREISSTSRDSNLPYLSKFIYCESNQQPTDVFEEVRAGDCFETISSVAEYRIWDGAVETIFRKNAEGQPDVASSKYRKDAEYQRSEWDSSSVERQTGRKWEVHNSSDSLIRSLRRWLGVGISDKHENLGLADNECTLVLQSRPWLSSAEIGSRGRWGKPSIEKCFIERCKEDGLFEEVRVEGVEIYQRGDNDELFRGSFSDTELSQDYVMMYDLEVDEDHNYIANGVLVHNCHALSSSAWQSLLIGLESQLGNSVFIFSTTNPEKIPETIITRVQVFKLSKISTDVIQQRLKYILDSEIVEGRNITYTDDALSYLARLSNGGMRWAITNLDKALAFDNNVTTETLVKALDLPNYDDYFCLLNGLVKKDNGEITAIIDRVYNSGTNFVKWFEGFHSFLCNIVKFIFLKDISRTMIPGHYLDKLQKYGTQHAAICLKLANVVMTMNKELKITQYQQEIAMTYLCSPVVPKKSEG